MLISFFKKMPVINLTVKMTYFCHDDVYVCRIVTKVLKIKSGIILATVFINNKMINKTAGLPVIDRPFKAK